MGVFQVKNKINGKVLIEGTIDIAARWNRHQMELKLGSHRKKEFQKDWNEFKAENFSFKILTELKYNEEGSGDYAEEVKLLEEMLISEMNIPADKMY